MESPDTRSVVDFARRIVESSSLDDKLTPPPTAWLDASRFAADDVASRAHPIPTAPGRPPELQIVPATEVRVPALEGMPDPAQRVRIVHALANHELQAAELFAWALLAFPDAPSAFRHGLGMILREEQLHTRWYIERLHAMGSRFGAYPVNGHFWHKTEAIQSPIDFVCAMSLTFENANLDHTREYSAAARAAGDPSLAKLIDTIHRDEIGHVEFGWRWLRVFKEEPESMWEAYCAHLTWPLRPARARGAEFARGPRELAGLDSDFIDALEQTEPAPLFARRPATPDRAE